MCAPNRAPPRLQRNGPTGRPARTGAVAAGRRYPGPTPIGQGWTLGGRGGEPRRRARRMAITRAVSARPRPRRQRGARQRGRAAMPAARPIGTPFGVAAVLFVARAGRAEGRVVAGVVVVAGRAAAGFTPDSTSTSWVAVSASPSPPERGATSTTARSAISRPPFAYPAPCGITTSTRPEYTNCSSASRKRAYSVGFPNSAGTPPRSRGDAIRATLIGLPAATDRRMAASRPA